MGDTPIPMPGDAARGGTQDLVDLLVEDHREVEELFRELESGQGDSERRRQVADVMIAELVRHSVAEEQYLYPTARGVLPDGDELADHETQEHAEAEKLMKRLEGLDPRDAEFDRLVGQLIDDVRHHIEEEEGVLFPKLRHACPQNELIDLARRIAAAKDAAPTRPHPSSPSNPPWNQLLDPGTGLVDKMRDALSRRPTRPDDL